MPPPLAGIGGGDNKTQGGGDVRREGWGRPRRNIRGAALIVLRVTWIVLKSALALYILSLIIYLMVFVGNHLSDSTRGFLLDIRYCAPALHELSLIIYLMVLLGNHLSDFTRGIWLDVRALLDR